MPAIHNRANPASKNFTSSVAGRVLASDVSRWSPGVDEGKPIDFVDNCYLIKHAQGWMLWDTGIPDAVAAMPNGLVPADPKGLFWRSPEDPGGPTR